MRSAIAILTAAIATAAFASPLAAQCTYYCEGTVSPAGSVVMVCPMGDAPTLASQGIAIELPFGGPVPEGSIAAREQCGSLVFCVPPVVDGPPDAAGTATFTGAVAGGGFADPWLWSSGYIPEPPCIVIGVPIRLVSPDINADLVVGLQDLALFAAAWPPNPYDVRADMNGDSVIGLVDLAHFADHFGHSCQ